MDSLARRAAPRCSAFGTPRTRPTTALGARPTGRCWPTALSRDCSGTIGPAPWRNGRSGSPRPHTGARRAQGGTMRTLRLLPLALALFGSQASAQALRLTGRVTDPDGKPIAAVRGEERGALNRALTRSDGTYELRVSSPDAIVVFSAVGYRRQDVSPAGSATLDVRMELPAFALEGIEVVGTRRANRSIVETPVAIDVIDIAEATRTTGQLDVNQLLHYAAPSFNANRQSGADGADHVDPASIRGLG